jgi:hypothetical protein
MTKENEKKPAPDSNELSDDQLGAVAGGMGLSPSQSAALAAASKGPAAGGGLGGGVNTPKTPLDTSLTPAQQPKT